MKQAEIFVQMMWRRRAPVLAALLLVLSGAGCNGNGSPTNPYGGGNNGGGGGTQFNLGPFAIGQSVKLTFANAGSIPYHCITHRNMGMTGTVQVDAAGADSQMVQVGAGGFSFAPSTAHIKPTGYVRWVNVSNLTVHTVVSDN